MLLQATRLATGAVKLAAASALGVADAAGTAAGPLITRSAAGVTRAVRIPEAVGIRVGELADAGVHRAGRRVWSQGGRAHIEVRGMTGHGHRHRRLARDVTAAVRAIEGVQWAEVNAVTQQLLAVFDEDAVDVDHLVEIVEAIEKQHGAEEETFSRLKPDHPSADAPVVLSAVEFAAGVAGLGVAIAGRLLRIPRLPAAARTPVLLAETYPRLRHTIEAHLGRPHTAVLLSVSTSVLHALTQGPGPLAVDSLHQFTRLVEARARQEVWCRRERELVGDGSALPNEVEERTVRPVPFPEGPVEKLGDRAALASLLGAGGVLAFTRDPGRAADLMLSTVPRAAGQGREAFASVLSWHLTRRGVIPMDPKALRRLDRIAVVVIDSSVLCMARPRVLSAVAVGGGGGSGSGLSDEQVWQIADDALVSAADRPSLVGEGPWTAGRWRFEVAPDTVRGEVGGPTAITLDIRDTRGRRCGRVRVGGQTDPLADAFLTAARGAAGRVVMTEHDSVGDLLAWADEVIAPGRGLTDHIRRLQADGNAVLLVSTGDDTALHAADVGIAVIREQKPVCWSAELICGPGLGEAWRLLRAVHTARLVSERSVRLAVGGSALGALIAVTGNRRTAGPGPLAPVHSAALIAVLSGAYSAHRLGRLETPAPTIRDNWHDISPQEAFRRLDQACVAAAREAEPPGRPSAPALARRAAERLVGGLPGMRPLIVAPVTGAVALSAAVVEELRDPLTPILTFGAAAMAVVGSGIDAVLLGSVMTGSAVVSGSQRLHAERALRGLLVGEQVNARRVAWRPAEAAEAAGAAEAAEPAEALGDHADRDHDVRPPDDLRSPDAGQTGANSWLTGLSQAPDQVISAEQLRVGDVVRVRSADVVPADLRLLHSDDLELDESSLTGESLPVAKSPAATPGADLDERTCMLFQGCTVLAGSGYGLVVAMGGNTEAGRAATLAASAAPPAGIQARLAELTRAALPAAGIGGLAVTGLAVLRGTPLRSALTSGVAVAVAAVPEGLALIATVAQLAAARRLSQRGVLVRSSRTLEALGRVDTLCFDKTGTLTQGRLAVTKSADITGDLPLGDAASTYLLRIAARACPSVGTGSAGHVVHATDRAVLAAARQHAGADQAWSLLDELPFETNRGFSAALGSVEGPYLQLAVKGAPEIVLAGCATVRVHGGVEQLTGVHLRNAHAALDHLAAEGLRVLAIAERHPGPDDVSGVDIAALVRGLTLVGFVGIADTPRPTAREAVDLITRAGVRVTVITGDHPSTASAVAAGLGIRDAHDVMTGAEFDRLRKQQRNAKVAATTVFARVSPEQKVRIVQALQGAGHVVAMTGDGSNDAAAIRLADVGIALADHGSAAARSAADLVLAEPDPARIAEALLEGRALWGRVRDAASILVGGNAGEVAFTVLGTAIGGRAPLSTRQLLLVNMLTDMMPALAVALAPARRRDGDEDFLAAGPVGGFWGPALARNLAVRGGATALGATLAWGCGLTTGRRKRAGTIGLSALVGTQLGQTLLTARHSPLVVATTAASALALFAVVQTPGVSRFFGCTPLGPVAWGIVAASSATATIAAAVAPGVLARFGTSGS